MGFKQKLIEFFEGKPDPLEKQLADAEQGRFRCYLHGTPWELKGAQCYLYSAASDHEDALDNIFKASQTILRLSSDGIETGPLIWGPSTPHLLAAALVTTNESRTIDWKDIEECILEVSPDRQLVFIVFDDSVNQRREWLAVRIAEDKVREQFLEHIRREGITISEHEGRVM